MKVSRPTVGAAVALAIVLVAAGVLYARKVGADRARRASVAHALAGRTELKVPHAKGAIVLDGDTDDSGWLLECARTGALVGPDGVSPARPYSEVRLVWGDGHLYLALYAADEDIRATHEGEDAPVWLGDSFHLLFTDGTTEHSFDVAPNGALADGERKAKKDDPGGAHPFDFHWSSGAHLSIERDGTLNNPDDNDEEWVVELAIPFEALGLKGEPGERVGWSVHRCDTPHSGIRSCGSWGEGDKKGVLVLE